MEHNLDLILTLTGGFTAALICGYLSSRLGLSPIAGYLVAGIIVGPHTPGFVADENLASQISEIGVILLMFGVGLQFHLKELLAVKKVAIPGAIAQIAVATALGAVTMHLFGWSWKAGIVFGLSISVASTVVLTRVLSDNDALHTRAGHIAIGWLLVEDIFTVVALVLMPPLLARGGGGNPAAITLAVGIALLKLAVLIGLTFLLGQRLIPKLLSYVARTSSRELFTLTVLMLALGIAVGAAKLFGASMALGAFLAGMVVGQSEFSNRAATEALPFRDAFAVIFFVAVGMLFNPAKLVDEWPMVVAATLVILLGKPLVAAVVVRLLNYPFIIASTVAIALAQIGEFSFILATLGRELGVFPDSALNVLVAAAIISITLNPILYKAVGPFARWVARRPTLSRWLNPTSVEDGAQSEMADDEHSAVIVGFGPVGRTLSHLLEKNGIRPVIVEMNLDTVRDLRDKGLVVVYGDAGARETLRAAKTARAEALILTSSSLTNSDEIIRIARELNPQIHIVARANYVHEQKPLIEAGAERVVTAEGEVALAMTEYLLRELGATPEQVDRERDCIREDFYNISPNLTVEGATPGQRENTKQAK
ncbi:MAG: cation:proton antiporter [Acidobacteria bacterium]|nr:cation:proton antiporter [Acidobacteriota bacterium]